MKKIKLTENKKLKFRLIKLIEKKKTSNKEKSEIASIEKQLSEMSIERKKKDNGLFDYYLADNNGKKIRSLGKDCNDFRQLGDGFYEYDFYLSTYKYKIDGYTLTESAKTNETINTIAKCIVNNASNEIFSGIKQVILYDHEKRHFLLELELLYFLMTMNDFEKKYDLPKKYDLNKQKLICVIDEKGEFIVKPTFKKIPVNYER